MNKSGETITNAIVKILQPGIGTGFLVYGENFIITCAHVVKDEDRILFQRYGETKKHYGIKVHCSNINDIAVYEVSKGVFQEEQGLKLGYSNFSANHKFLTYGYALPAGSRGHGTIGYSLKSEKFNVEVIQLESKNVTAGFSGAPVYDESLGLVVGIISHIADKDRFGRMDDVAFMIPAETVFEFVNIKLYKFGTPDIYYKLKEGSKLYYEDLISRGRFKYIDIVTQLLPSLKVPFRVPSINLNNEENHILSLVEGIKLIQQHSINHAVIVGEGGIGKTVSMLTLWQHYLSSETSIPIFLSLNDYNQAEDPKRFLINYITRYYLRQVIIDQNLESEIWNLFINNLDQEGISVPSTLILLDGFNEVTADQLPLLLELNEWIRRGKGIQMVFTSRYDMRVNFNWSSFHLLNLTYLREEQIKEYLSHFSQTSYPQSKILQDLITIPFNLTLFATTSEISKNYQSHPFFSFKQNVKSTSDLLWNYLEAQLVKKYEEGIGMDRVYQYKFLINHVLASISYEMEQNGWYEISEKNLNLFIDQFYQQFQNIIFTKAFFICFSYYGESISLLNFNISDPIAIIKRTQDLKDLLCKKLVILVNEVGVYRLLHQNFRDYLAALHVYQNILLSEQVNLVPQTLKSRAFPIYIRRYLGDLAGELPYQFSDKIKESSTISITFMPTILTRIIESLRNVFDREIVGYTVWNVVMIWRDTRGDLSGVDLRNLYLIGLPFNQTKCYKKINKTYLCANFDGSLIDENNFLPLGHIKRITSVCYSMDGKRILSGSEDRTIKEWSVDTGECLRIFFEHLDFVSKACYSIDGKKILSASEDATIKEWSVETGQCIQTLSNSTTPIQSISYSPDNQNILSVHKDGTINIWSVESGKCMNTLIGEKEKIITASYSMDGEKILSVSEGGFIKEWFVNTGKCLTTYYCEHTVTSASYSNDKSKLLTAIWSREIEERSVATGASLRIIKGHKLTIMAICYSPDNKKILSGSKDKTIKEWSADTGECLQTLKGHEDTITSVSYSADGKKILSASIDRTIKEWSTVTGECLQTINGWEDFITSANYDTAGKKIIVGSRDRTIKEWSIETGICLQIITSHKDTVTSVSYSPDDKKILSGSKDKTIKEWSADTGECLRTLKGHEDTVTSVSYSADGKKILSASQDRTIKEWSVDTGDCLQTLKGHKGLVIIVGYSADNKKILSGSLDKTIKEWSVETGKCLQTIKDHDSHFTLVGYSENGKKILSSSRNGTIKEWSVKTGKCLKTIINRTDQTSIVGFRVYGLSKNGKRMLYSDNDTIKERTLGADGRLQTFINVPGLLIQKCTFMNLHKASNIQSKTKDLFKKYGAIIN